MRLSPRSAANRIEGIAREPDGSAALKLAVTAPPVDGKANAALIAFLAKSLEVPKSSLSVLKGTAARQKLLHLAGEPALLLPRLERWLAALHG